MINSFKSIRQADLTAALKDVGNEVSYNGFESSGFLQTEATESLQLNGKLFSVQDTTLTLTIASGSLGPLKATKASAVEYITVDGVKYKLDKWINVSDVETKIWVSGTQS